MHELKIIDGKLHLDEKQIRGVSDFTIKSSTNNNGRLVELDLKMMVTLVRVDVESRK